MRDIGKRRALHQFITEAEQVWFRVFYAGEETRRLSVDGVPLATLPRALSSRGRILRYFRRYWGTDIARRMLRNLPLATWRGRLFVIRYDPGPLSTEVRTVLPICRARNTVAVRTALTGGPEGVTPVTHILTSDIRGTVICRRIGPQYDYRYYNPSEQIWK